MPESFQLEIVTPTRVIDCGAVEYLRAPSLEGLFGVMARHVPAMISLCTGEIKVVQNGATRYYATNGGYADIHRENVQLLVETCEEAGEIDVERAREAASRARERLGIEHRDQYDQARADAALRRAMNRLWVAERKG